MPKFLVKQFLQPVWCVVEAVDEEEAIKEALNEDEWNQYSDYDECDYTAKEIEED